MRNTLLQITIIFILITISSSFDFFKEKMVKNKILIIDSGINNYLRLKYYLCQRGHRSFLKNNITPFKDETGHGTVMAEIVSSYINQTKTCIVIYNSFAAREDNSKAYMFALLEASKHDFKAIMIAIEDDDYANVELELYKRFKKDIKIFISSGNQGKNLDKKCNTYPACLKIKLKSSPITIIGSSVVNHKKFNYGKIIDQYESPNYLQGRNPQQGTSVSTARALGKYAASL